MAKLAIIEAEASGGRVLNPSDLPYDQNREVFLYLAGATYANQVATLDIAIHHQFLWRTYFADVSDIETQQAIANVASINAGDIIVLAFRNGDSTFRILSALVVQPEMPRLQSPLYQIRLLGKLIFKIPICYKNLLSTDTF